MTVCVGLITYRHGTDCYVGRDRLTLYAKLAAFCRQWWSEVRPGSPPEDNEQCVAAYFDAHPSEYLDLHMGEETD